MKTISAAIVAAALVATNAASWSVQQANIGNYAAGISFASLTTGYLSVNTTTGATILNTQDGGKTWNPPSNFTSLPPYSLTFGVVASGNTVVASAGASMLTSHDQGDTWTAFTQDATKAFVVPTKVFTAGSAFVAPGQIYDFGDTGGAVLQTGLLVSKDQGNTWTTTNLTDVAHTTLTAGAGVGDSWFLAGGTFGDFGGDDNQAMLKTGSTAHVTTGDQEWSAEILVSHDAGSTWTSAFFDEGQFTLTDIDCSTAQTCCAVGAGIGSGPHPSSRVYCTNDGGRSWNLNLFFPSDYSFLTTVKFLSPTHAMALGGLGGAKGVGTALQFDSTDGGKTWTRTSIDVGAIEVTQASFPSPTEGHAVAIDPATNQASVLIWQ